MSMSCFFCSCLRVKSFLSLKHFIVLVADVNCVKKKKKGFDNGNPIFSSDCVVCFEISVNVSEENMGPCFRSDPVRYCNRPYSFAIFYLFNIFVE